MVVGCVSTKLSDSKASETNWKCQFPRAKDAGLKITSEDKSWDGPASPSPKSQSGDDDLEVEIMSSLACIGNDDEEKNDVIEPKNNKMPSSRQLMRVLGRMPEIIEEEPTRPEDIMPREEFVKKFVALQMKREKDLAREAKKKPASRREVVKKKPARVL